MPTLKLEFKVYCSCGNGLCFSSREGKNGHSQYITVEPCEKCQNIAYDEGYDHGDADGYESGLDDGWEV